MEENTIHIENKNSGNYCWFQLFLFVVITSSFPVKYRVETIEDRYMVTPFISWLHVHAA